MVKLFTVSKKGGNGGKEWNGANPQKFFPFIQKEGVKKIWDVRRTPNGALSPLGWTTFSKRSV